MCDLNKYPYTYYVRVMSDFMLTVCNQELYEFYEKYALDFEQTNILFMGIMKDLVTNMDTSLNSSVANRLLDNVAGISTQLTAMDAHINKQQAELNAILRLHFADHRREFMDEIKLILTSNNVEQIKPLIKESTEMVLLKTSAILAEFAPQNQSAISENIQTQFAHLKQSIEAETAKVFGSTLHKTDIEAFQTNIVESMNQAHGILTSVITSSENRTDTKINEVKQLFVDTTNTSNTLQSSVFEMLKKFEKSSGKGNVSEHVVYNILLNLYPCAQIDHVGNDIKESGDIILCRTNKPKILIENKDHDSRNVPKVEVDKFIRDCTVQNCCGIMLAQNRGITNKEHFEIQINNGNVLLFVHEVDFNVDKIKTAVEIVEHFKIKLDDVAAKKEDCVIDKELLTEINRDFSAYAAQKHAILKMVKDFNDKMNASIGDLKMPALEKYLGARFATSNLQTENICKYCEKYIPKSIMQHYRYCTAKREFDSTVAESAEEPSTTA